MPSRPSTTRSRGKQVPEGDSLHRAAALLQPLVGERIAAASPHPRALETGVARIVDGRVLEGVEAVGKNLLLRFGGGVVVRSHLRMNGRWRLDRAGAPCRGRPWLVLRGREWEARQWNGPVLELGERSTAAARPRRPRPSCRRRHDRSRPAGERPVAVARRGTRRPAIRLGHREHVARRDLSGRDASRPGAGSRDVSDPELAAAVARARQEMSASVSGPRPPRAVYRRAGRGCAGAAARRSSPAASETRTGRRTGARPARPESGGGGGEIRTLETLARLTVFETAPFDRSGTPPRAPKRSHASLGVRVGASDIVERPAERWPSG